MSDPIQPLDAHEKNTMLGTPVFLGMPPHGVPAPHVHILPKWVYYGVLGALLFLTVITVLTAQVNLGPFNLPLAMVIALTKGTLVAAIFMHLWWDNKFNLLIFVTSLLFLSVFIIITMLDTEGREIVDPQRQNFLPRDERVEKLRETDADGTLRPGEPFGATAGKENYLKHQGEHGGGHGSVAPANPGTSDHAAPAPAPTH